jgi:hypothetical protein
LDWIWQGGRLFLPYAIWLFNFFTNTAPLKQIITPILAPVMHICFLVPENNRHLRGLHMFSWFGLSKAQQQANSYPSL